MTWKDRTIIIESVVIVLLVVCCFGILKFYHNPKMVFEWNGKTTETVYIPNPLVSYEHCYKSKIVIDGKQNGDNFLVTARDDCKYASRLLSVRTGGNYHGITPMLIGAVEYDNDTQKLTPGYGAQLQYSYTWGPAGISTGAGVVKFSNKYNILILFGGTFKIQDK